MKKISYITHYAPIPSTNADSICIMETCNAFSKNNISIHLIIPSEFPGVLKVSEEQEIWDFYGFEKSFFIKKLPSMLLYKLGFVGRFIYKTISVFAGIWEKSDLLFLRHVETAILGGFLGRKLVLEHHQIADIEDTLSFKMLVKLSKKREMYFITVTNSAAARLTNLGINLKQVLVAPMAVTLEAFTTNNKQVDLRKTFQLPLNKKIVMHSGHLYEGRGIEELIEAMRGFPDLLLVIVGGFQNDIDRCKRIAQNNQQENILFIGSVLPKEVPSYLMAADILIMPYTTNTPTHKDMSPMKMFDYMASGKPIVSSDFLVLREILEDKVNAVFVAPDSSSALAGGIQWVLDNPKKAKGIAAQTRKDAENYTWDKRAKKIVCWLNKHLE